MLSLKAPFFVLSKRESRYTKGDAEARRAEAARL